MSISEIDTFEYEWQRTMSCDYSLPYPTWGLNTKRKLLEGRIDIGNSCFYLSNSNACMTETLQWLIKHTDS